MKKIEKNEKISIKIMAQCGLLIALSALGALIKIQGTIALDSMAGFFGVLYIDLGAGALISGVGHLLTAVTSGFPLTLPMHFLIATEMTVFTYIFGWVYRKGNGIMAIIAGILLNGPISLWITSTAATMLELPLQGKMMFNLLVLPLTVASAVNIILAYAVNKVVMKTKVGGKNGKNKAV